MKFISFRLSDLYLKGEGNLHVVVLNRNTSQVFRFIKEIRNGIKPTYDIDLSDLNTNKLFTIEIQYKKYIDFQKFWGKEFLPKTRIGLFPKQIIEQIAAYLENQRSESHKGKSIITSTSYVEILSDLSTLPRSFQPFTEGNTFCIELKMKFGILFHPNDQKWDCRNRMSRYCITQLKKSASSKMDYCPCDLFCGNLKRMKRAIFYLIKGTQEKIRLFQNGEKSRIINNELIKKIMDDLYQQKHVNEETAFDNFCELILKSITHDVSGKHKILKFHCNISTNCQAHDWSDVVNDENDKNFLNIYRGSVLGTLIKTNCLLQKKSEEIEKIYMKLKIILQKNNIPMLDNIFDLWNEFLLPMDLPEDVIKTIKILKKYMVCLTTRNCSMLIKFKRASINDVSVKQSNVAILDLTNGSQILTMTDIVDTSIKPLSKITSNYQYEQELVKIYH